MRPKRNSRQNTVCLDQQIYASQENFTPLLIIIRTYINLPIQIAFKLSVAKCVNCTPVYPADGYCMAADDWLTGRLSVQS